MFVAAAEGEAERFAAFWRGSQAQGRGLASRYVRVVKLLLDPCRSINLSLPIPPNRQTVPPATADASKHPRFREGGGRTLGWKNEGGDDDKYNGQHVGGSKCGSTKNGEIVITMGLSL